jgi:hypothetical protein
LHAVPRVAMTIGNYVHGQRLTLLRRACDRAGITLRHIGAHGEGEQPADEILNDADIVFGKARVIVEALATGRAAYVFDHNGGDGWVTAASYARLADDNFGGQSLADVIDEDGLVRDLALYDPQMGLVNLDLAVVHHAAAKHAAALVEVLERVAAAPRVPPPDAPLREMARLVRLYHRADAQSFALRPALEQLAIRTSAAEARAAELRGQLDELQRHAQQAAERDTSRDAALGEARAEIAAQADRAERSERMLREVVRTRRWRSLQALLAPADRLRARRETAPPPPPAPFVVGVARSGTTLLRLQLDAHPELAVGPETGFGLVASLPATATAAASTLLDAVTKLETWPDLALDRDEARRALERVQPWSTGAGLRALYRTLAAHEGKSRWGDKTPIHLGCMPALAAALPEARFIHLIRDGRDVAASVRGLPFAPGDGSIEAIARDWRDQIVAGRADAGGLAHIREVRYERLVHEPEAVLRELCDFLELTFDPAMMRAHERAADVMARLPHTRDSGGAPAARAELMARHAHLSRPPDPSRAGRWRAALSSDEVARFEAIAGGLLAELGYETVA